MSILTQLHSSKGIVARGMEPVNSAAVPHLLRNADGDKMMRDARTLLASHHPICLPSRQAPAQPVAPPSGEVMRRYFRHPWTRQTCPEPQMWSPSVRQFTWDRDGSVRSLHARVLGLPKRPPAAACTPPPSFETASQICLYAASNESSAQRLIRIVHNQLSSPEFSCRAPALRMRTGPPVASGGWQMKHRQIPELPLFQRTPHERKWS